LRTALGTLLLAASAGRPARPPSPPTRAGELHRAGDLTRLRGKLPRTAMRIARHEDLTVVAIGSSSTQGVGASAPAASYPSQMAAELARRLPRESVTVLKQGRRRPRPRSICWRVSTATCFRRARRPRDLAGRDQFVLRDAAVAPTATRWRPASSG